MSGMSWWVGFHALENRRKKREDRRETIDCWTSDSSTCLVSLTILASCLLREIQHLLQILNFFSFLSTMRHSITWEPPSVRGGRYLKLWRNFTFQQDDEPKHTANAAQVWVIYNPVNVLQWPSYIPDLNPIKNQWQCLKIALNKQPGVNLPRRMAENPKQTVLQELTQTHQKLLLQQWVVLSGIIGAVVA